MNKSGLRTTFRSLNSVHELVSKFMILTGSKAFIVCRLATVVLATTLTHTNAFAQVNATMDPDCGQLRSRGQYGPYDYRTATPEQKEMVEFPHFDAEWAGYLAGKNTILAAGGMTSPVAGGLDYTLRAFPNHHRALLAMDKVAFRMKQERPNGAKFRVACYFQRAIVFAPDDGLVRAIYGAYFALRGKAESAKEQLDIANDLAPENLNVQSQIAWSLMEIQDWVGAEKHAKLAYKYGYPLPGLRDKLKKSGHWAD